MSQLLVWQFMMNTSKNVRYVRWHNLGNFFPLLFASKQTCFHALRAVSFKLCIPMPDKHGKL